MRVAIKHKRMAGIKQTERASRLLNQAFECSRQYRHEFITPEHLLLVMIDEFNFNKALNMFMTPETIRKKVESHLEEMEAVPEGNNYEPEMSSQLGQVIEYACQQVLSSSATALDIPHYVMGILHLQESWACYLLKDALGDREGHFLSQLLNFYDFEDQLDKWEEEGGSDGELFENEEDSPQIGRAHV